MDTLKNAVVEFSTNFYNNYLSSIPWAELGGTALIGLLAVLFLNDLAEGRS